MILTIVTGCGRHPHCAAPAGAEPRVHVPGGMYNLGCVGCGEDGPHSATLKDFEIDSREVLLREVLRCKQDGPCRDAQFTGRPSGDPDEIAAVEYHTAIEYCLSRQSDLPTPDEWEAAARGSDGRKYPWGDRWSSDHVKKPVSRWVSGDYLIGYYRACGSDVGVSPFGVRDLVGNGPEFVRSSSEAPQLRGGPDSGVDDPQMYTATYVMHGKHVRAAFRCVRRSR